MSPIFSIKRCGAGVSVSWKNLKIEKDQALNHHWKQEKVTNKFLYETFRGDYYHAHNRGAFGTRSNILDKDFGKNVYLVKIIWRFSAQVEISTH